MEDNQHEYIGQIKSIFWFWKELVILVLAVTTGVLSFKFNAVLSPYGDNAGLFGRSGSILVLLAVINEYRLRSLRDRQLSYHELNIVRNNTDEIRQLFRPQVLFGQKIVTIGTHMLVVFGTIIWGFGDLLV